MDMPHGEPENWRTGELENWRTGELSAVVAVLQPEGGVLSWVLSTLVIG